MMMTHRTQQDYDHPSIGVIGAGWLGGTVGRSLARAGYTVAFSSRHPDRLAHEVADLPMAFAAPVDEAAACDIVLFATPYEALESYGRRFAEILQGKVVIDATNPGGNSPLGLQAAIRGVAEMSRAYFPGARLVRCFSAVDASCIAERRGYGESLPLAVPVAGDHAWDIALAEELVRATGCVPVVTGDLSTARLFQRGGPGFGVNTHEARLRDLMGQALAA